MTFLQISILLSLFPFSSFAFGQNSLIYRAKSSKVNEITVSGGFVFKKSELKVGKTAAQTVRSTLDVERHMIGAGFAMGVGKRIDAYGFGAYHLKSELEGIASEDSGFVLGAGLKLLAVRFSEAGIYSYLDLNYTNETYDSDLKATYVEAHVGAMARLRVLGQVNFMAGLEFIPFFSGKGNFGGVEEKLENRRSMSVIFGVVIPFIYVRSEATFLGGNSFTAVADYKVSE